MNRSDRWLVLLLVALAAYGASQWLYGGEAEAPAGTAAPPAADARAAGGDGAEGGVPARAVLDAARVCADAGYLCPGLRERGEARIVRWSDDTGALRIRIPRPAGVPDGRARELQQAAARGIRAWQGRPFPLRVDLSGVPGRHDFVVRWAGALDGRELGRARTRWSSDGRRSVLRVEDFVLATHAPGTDRPLDLTQVELTAAHEMGHALGLPHSDDERDVMYPLNGATRLTARDYRTVQRLYELENGAEIR